MSHIKFISYRLNDNPLTIMMNQVSRTVNFNDPSRIRKTDKGSITKLVLQRDKSQLQLPKSEFIPPLKEVRIMKTPVTVELFKRVMELKGGYNISGQDSEKLIEYINNPKNLDLPLSYINLADAVEFFYRLAALTGRKYRLPTRDEILRAKDFIKCDKFILINEKKSFKNQQFIYGFYQKEYIFGRLNPLFRHGNLSLLLVEEV